MIEELGKISKDKTLFSLEVINKSMMAVDLIKKYKVESKNGRNGTQKEIDDVE